MYDKKGATGGNGVGPGPAMLIAGIFPAPPTFLAQLPTSSPSLIHVRPRVYMCARVCMCIYVCVCMYFAWESGHFIPSVNSVYPPPLQPSQRKESKLSACFSLESLNVRPEPFPRIRLLAFWLVRSYFLLRPTRIFVFLKLSDTMA